MLIHLQIRNFALIDRVDLELGSGFTVLTGETGSGKSILLGALGLIMGERADFSLIGPAGDKSFCEAVFKIDKAYFADWFLRNDLDLTEEIVIRREIHSGGKSRAFINDTPVSLTVLKELSGSLFHIHSQYNTIELRSTDYQLELLDALAGIEVDALNFKREYNTYTDERRKWLDLKESCEHLVKKSDYDEFQREEIAKLQPEKYDFELLEREFHALSNSEEVKVWLHSLEEEINGDGRILDQLKKLEIGLSKLSGIHRLVDEMEKRLHTLILELKDITEDSNRIVETGDLDPSRLESITGILDNYNRILKKHGLVNQNALLTFYKELENRSADLHELKDRIEKGEIILKKKLETLVIWADELHHTRLTASSDISKKILDVLGSLKLSGTRLQFFLEEKSEIDHRGKTSIRLLFSANAGTEMIPIEQAASGGELSRVMLALQKVLSEKKLMPTILFDEIDTGVSGEVAEKMGALLASMGEHRQLIAITHLPQVAAKGNTHFKVEKITENGRTQSSVISLNEHERIEEVARLLSGEIISQAAIENARALMN
jgi:DNA repair protein RecN (Recombination protein N)